MCSIFKYRTVIGRNFDYEVSYNEEPRIIEVNKFDNKYKIIGMATGFVKDYPLLYDGINEKGLTCAALAFVGNAKYNSDKDEMMNIPAYNFVLYILGHYQTVSELKKDIHKINITNTPYSEEMPNSDLHWFIADKNESIIIEQTIEGLKAHDGDIMTNNPPYELQKDNCASESLSVGDISEYPHKNQVFDSRGMNTVGLKGDYTSMGRFQRLTYLKNNLESVNSPFDDVIEGFHLLSSVEQIYANTPVNEKFEYTIYSAVYDTVNISMDLKNYSSNQTIHVGIDDLL